MNFMKKEKEDRAKERESDKEEIKDMILNGVKEEVEKNINPILERQNSLEETQADMKEQFREMVAEVKGLKTRLDSSKTDRQEQTPSLPSSLVPPSGQSENSPSFGSQDLDPKVAEIIDMARRTIGLHKIDRDDLARMRLEHYGGATTEEEEKVLAVREYLKCELKIGQDESASMEIENIFIPAKEKDDPKSLNVTFKNFSSISKIYERTRIMRKESRINNYIPRQFNDQLRTIGEFDYSLRLDRKYQTRIKMGLLGLELHKKLRGSSKWEKVTLPKNLPPVDLSGRPVTPATVSQSPPPGRPGHESTLGRDKRGRGSSGSETEQTSSKIAKQSGNNSEANKLQAAKCSVDNYQENSVTSF